MMDIFIEHYMCVYPYINHTRQGNTLSIEAIFFA